MRSTLVISAVVLGLGVSIGAAQSGLFRTIATTIDAYLFSAGQDYPKPHGPAQMFGTSVRSDRLNAALFNRSGKGPRADYRTDVPRQKRIMVAERLLPPIDFSGARSHQRAFVRDPLGRHDNAQFSPAGLPVGIYNRNTARSGPVPDFAPEHLAPLPQQDVPRATDSLTFVPDDERRGPGYRRLQIACLALAIFREGGSDPIEARLAIAQTIANRVRSPHYPETFCRVVYQRSEDGTRCQFQFTCEPNQERPTDRRHWKLALKLATEVYAGDVWLSHIGEATHYHRIHHNPGWKKYMSRIKRIGSLVFYQADFIPARHPAGL